MSTLTTALRQLRPALVVVALFTLLCGLAYPVSVWAISRIDSTSAEGAIIRDSAGCAVGSALLATDPQTRPGQPDPYFHARVAGSGDQADPTLAAMTPGDPAAGAPSNLGPSTRTWPNGSPPGVRSSPSARVWTRTRCRSMPSPGPAPGSTRTSRPSMPRSRSTGWRGKIAFPPPGCETLSPSTPIAVSWGSSANHGCE